MARRKKTLPDFFDDFERLQLEMEKMLGDFGTAAMPDNQRRTAMAESREPLVDVIERSEDITVMAELPGVEKGEIRLRLSGGTLIIDAPREGIAKHYREIRLPAKVRSGKAKASFKNGVLEIVLRKARPGRPPETELEIK
ncbi:Small heat shock protein HSP16.5 [uncultured archaeon]|nr:Small heat shock protein HSP16.5 [uncultured archaeon]